MKISSDDLIAKPKGIGKRKPTKAGRIPYTTMIKPELRDQLTTIAINTGTSVAEVLEAIVTQFINELKKNATNVTNET